MLHGLSRLGPLMICHPINGDGGLREEFLKFQEGKQEIQTNLHKIII